MFATVTRAGGLPEARALDIFQRFKEVPGLQHAYFLRGTEGSYDAQVVSIWESREAAEHYMLSSPLRAEVDGASVGAVTRHTYDVLDSK